MRRRVMRLFASSSMLLALSPAPFSWRVPHAEGASPYLLVTSAENAAAFCNTSEGMTANSICHKDMVRQALGFLRPWPLQTVIDHVPDPDHNSGLNYESAQHFDECNFDGGTGYINRRYGVNDDKVYGAIPYLSPRHRQIWEGPLAPTSSRMADYPLIEAGLTEWARGLHTAQDFYSHSNWVEIHMGLPRSSDDVVDARLGPWNQLSARWGTRVRGDVGDGFGDVITSQDAAPAAWRLNYPGNRYVPIFTEPNGRRHHLLVSGEVSSFTPNHCPAGTHFSHAELNKDDGLELQGNPPRVRPHVVGALHRLAAAMAIRQTRHEWCRLLHLALNRNGPEGAAVFLGLLANPRQSPHPPGTPCQRAAPGPVRVTVEVTDIEVLNDHEDDGPGQLNFVFSVFTEDMKRSMARQVDTIRVETHRSVPREKLPPVITLCVAGTDKIVATVQGWEDDGDANRTALSNGDDLLSGVVYALGTASQLEPRRPVAATRRSANSNASDLAVSFRATVVPTPTAVRCNEQHVAAD